MNHAWPSLTWRPAGWALSFGSYERERGPMIKKLSAVGNSLALIIERPILELLDITKDTVDGLIGQGL